MSATGQDHFHQHFDPFTPGFAHAVANDIADLKSKVGKRTCAVMLEMIQGEGGVLPLEPAFVSAVAELCRERDILLIVDEVQTGIGRCGTLYAYEQYGIHPDIVTTAKGLGNGLPIGCPGNRKRCIWTPFIPAIMVQRSVAIPLPVPVHMLY